MGDEWAKVKIIEENVPRFIIARRKFNFQPSKTDLGLWCSYLGCLRLYLLLFACTLLAFESADPADVAHTGLDILHMELVFE